VRLVQSGTSSAERAVIEVKRNLPPWPGLLKQLNEYPKKKFIISCKDVDEVWRRFKKRYRILRAGGGLVLDRSGRVLLIHRLGHWDLPKGKLEIAESIVDCAIREVEEECQVEGLGIRGKLGVTYHIMKKGRSRFLKESHWYLMNTFYDEDPIPQLEEGIERAEWVEWKKLDERLDDAWPSVQEVFKMLAKDKRFKGSKRLMNG